MCEECTRSVLDNLGLKSCQVALGCWDWVEARAVSWRKTTASKTNLAVTDNLMQTIQLSNISTPHSTTPRQIQTYSYMMWEKNTYADLTVQNIRTPLSTSWSSSLRRSWRQIAWHQKPGELETVCEISVRSPVSGPRQVMSFDAWKCWSCLAFPQQDLMGAMVWFAKKTRLTQGLSCPKPGPGMLSLSRHLAVSKMDMKDMDTPRQTRPPATLTRRQSCKKMHVISKTSRNTILT